MSKNIFSGLTVNWHFTQRCNMGCKYCFVARCKELGKPQYDIILGKLKDKFERVNFVGGEPTVSPYILDLIKATKEYGLKATIVTNGDRMVKEPEFADEILGLVDGVGISIDSLNPSTNSAIGRHHGHVVLTEDEYIALCRKIKSVGLPLKINTVVSRVNLDENFTSFYETVRPDRIKMFQVLVPNLQTKTDYSDFLIAKDEYDAFVMRHKEGGFNLIAEDNEHMLGSYLMVNSDGCFEDDETGIRSRSLLDPLVTAESALKEVNIDMKKYMSRYSA